jgi:hypothetical protein
MAVEYQQNVLVYLPFHSVGLDSSVIIGTCYGQDGPEIESQCGQILPRPSRLALGITQSPVQRVLGLFPGGKAAGAWR